MIHFILCIAAAYLLGSIPSAYLAGRLLKNIDIRQHGSGNVGASNVFRVVGKKWGILVLIADALKGFLALVLIARWGYQHHPLFSKPLYFLLTGMAAVAGHNWTVFLNFHGGKGVATSLGVGLGLFPKAALLALSVWIALLIPFGYIAVSSMAAALSFPLWIFLLYRHIEGFMLILGITIVLAVLLIYMHSSNIQRLLRGTENRVWKPDIKK